MCSEKAVDGDSLSDVFNALFLEQEGTVLRGGASEPLYEPAQASQPAIIHYREDFAASALHEVAHWCIAGPSRRKLLDYGYWYEPDGRDAITQQRFALVEAKPQALEWCFAQAAGLGFRLSLDNLDGAQELHAIENFRALVQRAAQDYQGQGLPNRARRFFDALADRFNPGFKVEDLSFEGKLAA